MLRTAKVISYKDLKKTKTERIIKETAKIIKKAKKEVKKAVKEVKKATAGKNIYGQKRKDTTDIP
jgi:hypothetical protein